MKRFTLLISVAAALAATPLTAEFRQIDITTFGMD
jgi:hypothetical protein